MDQFQRVLQSAAYSSVGRFVKRRWESGVIRGFAEHCRGTLRGRALVSYLVAPVRPPAWLRDRVVFSNHGIAQELPRAINELGFSVDIINYDNDEWEPRGTYDLFVGHGGRNFARLAHGVPGARSVYFSTGLYWRDANVREARRFLELTERTGFLLPPDRTVMHSEEDAVSGAHGVIALGNDFARRSYHVRPDIHLVSNAAFPISEANRSLPDHRETRRGFLFFSGRGAVHKGLDRLLAAFAGTRLELHVCQHPEPEFVRVFQQELRAPNVHVHGFVPMRSDRFRRIASMCSWVVLPTCSDAQPGSVIECMAHGLLPILPESASIDIGGFGLELAACDIATVRATCLAASEMNPDECCARARVMRKVVDERHTPEAFRGGVRASLAEIMSGTDARR